jgi:hypothetical protein
VLRHVRTVYVIPGGGSGSAGATETNTTDYPEWTRRRVVDAVTHWKRKHEAQSDAIFLTLSAGSMNSPNKRYDDGRIKFECQHTMDHLKSLGVPANRVFGDMLSWDTVTNGLTLRLFLEGVLAYQPELLTPPGTVVADAALARPKSLRKMDVLVFIRYAIGNHS